jgi:hypothetical protein
MCVRTYSALLGLKQGRTLARRGVPGERRYAPVLENAQVRSNAEFAFDRTVPGRDSKDSTKKQKQPGIIKKFANLIFLDFIYTKARNKIK